MIETRHLKNVVIFVQTILSFVLSRKIINSKILSEKPTQQQKPCNCRYKESCPLKGNCQAQNIEYKATVATQNHQMYHGASEGESKLQFINHNLINHNH